MNRKILLLLIIAIAVFALCAFLVSANNSTADISEEDSISNTESEISNENESSSDNKSSSDDSEIVIEERDIDFEIGFWDIHCETIEPDQSLIINSYSEMQNFYKIIKFKSQTIEDLKKYDEDYFRDNSILLITHTESSGSIYHQLDNVVKKGNQVLVYETVIYPSDGTCDMAYWLFAIEVKKSDINGAEDIDVICNCKPGNDKLIN